MKAVRKCTVAVLAAFLAVLPRSDSAAQKDGGFGISKESIKVTSIRPPKVLVSQSAYSVSVGGPAADEGIRAQVVSGLRTIVQEANPTIAYVEGKGKLRITVSIDALDYATNQFTKIVTKSKGWGKNRQEWKENHSIVRVTTAFRASYLAEDWTGGAPFKLDGDVLSRNLSNDFDLNENQTPWAREVLRQVYVDELVKRLRPRLAPHADSFFVILGDVSGDKLQRGNNLGKAGQWQAAYDEWSSLPTFQSPKAESYRVFNKGVAREALAYEVFKDSRDAAAALEHLTEAEKLYNEALMLKPQEKYFREDWRTDSTSPAPLERVRAARRDFEEWQNQMEATAAAIAAAAPPRSAGSKSTGPSGSADVEAMTNDDVIQLVLKNASEAFIRETIRTAPRTQFDLSPKARIRLLDAQVPEAVISFMAERNNRGMARPQAPKGRRRARP